MAGRSKVRVVGPLAQYASGFNRELRGLGYTRLSAEQQLRLMAHLSRWPAGEGLEAAALTAERVGSFCVARRGEGYRRLRTTRALAPLRGFLQQQGALPELAARVPAGEDERLLARYRDYLVDERGLAERGVATWVQAAGLFLAEYPGLLGEGPAQLPAGRSPGALLDRPDRPVQLADHPERADQLIDRDQPRQPGQRRIRRSDPHRRTPDLAAALGHRLASSYSAHPAGALPVNAYRASTPPILVAGQGICRFRHTPS